MSTLGHLEQHHGDFAAFRDKMVETHAGRFDGVFWATWAHFVAPAIPRAGACILDLGTGPGLLLAELAERHEGATVVGIECQPKMLESARQVRQRVGARAILVEADLAAPPWPELRPATVHAAIASAVVHEMRDPMPMLAEVARLLRPGGAFVLGDWHRHSLRQYAAESDLRGAELISHFREHCSYDVDDYAELVRRAGLEVVETMIRKGGRSCLVVARRPA